MTINRAAQVVRPGQRVVVKTAVYRELVRPRLGGNGPGKMISFEAAPGAKVIIKGSRVFKPQWKKSKKGDTTYSAALLDDYFGSYNPFLTENASKEDIDLMPWATQWAGKLPYTLGRGGRWVVFLSTNTPKSLYIRELWHTVLGWPEFCGILQDFP